MALACKALKQDKGTKLTRLYVQVTPSGNYVTDGDTLDLTKITDPNFIGFTLPGPGIANLDILPAIHAESMAGYYAQVVQGADLAHYKISFWVSEDSQVAAAGYPAAISGGTLILELVF